jgi:DNA polymerase
MDESSSATNKLQAELLYAVKGLKAQVVNQNSLSVGMKWKKEFQDIKKVKADFSGATPAGAGGSFPKRDIPRLAESIQPPAGAGGFLQRGNKEDMLKKVCQEMANCQLCPLGKTRHNLVFGDGNPHAQILFVGEAPGADEDEQGLPFVGRAGQLLTDIIVKGMKLKRKDVYICNILKCRPPGNRNPLPNEISICEPFLKKQLQIISPKIICALGTFAAQTLLKTDIPISALRGRFHSYEGIKLMPTYHPAYLLRNPSAKKPVWEDVQMIMKEVPV